MLAAFRRLALALAAILLVPALALAHDCSDTRANAKMYLDNCRAVDNCAMAEQVRYAVKVVCGEIKVDDPKKETPKPPELSAGEVRSLQDALNRLGYGVGGVDGKLGPATRAAAARAMAALGISGELNAAAVAAIVDAAARKAAEAAEKPDKPEKPKKASNACEAYATIQGVDFAGDWQKVAARLSLLRDLESEIGKLKADLASDTRWAASDFRFGAALTLKTAETVGNLLVNGWQLNPVTGAPTRALGRLKAWGVEKIKSAKQAFVDGSAAALRLKDGEFTKLAVDVVLDAGSAVQPMVQWAILVRTFTEDMTGLMELPSGFAAMRAEARRATDMMDRQLVEVRRKIAEAEDWRSIQEGLLTAGRQACEEEKAGGTEMRLP